MESYHDTDDIDRYEIYEEQFNPLRYDRQARRKRRPKTTHQPKKNAREMVEDAAETIGLEGGFETSYNPSLYERSWLMHSLREFYQQELISDVEALIKGGKEANVYRCAAPTQPRVKPGWRSRSTARACSATCATTTATARGARC